jgi:hypothetical protein
MAFRLRHWVRSSPLIGFVVSPPTPRDPTGYSWHADFQNGWDTTALQNAIDKCDNPNDQTGSGGF